MLKIEPVASAGQKAAAFNGAWRGNKLPIPDLNHWRAIESESPTARQKHRTRRQPLQ